MFEKSLERQFVIVPTGMSDPENGVSGRKNKKKNKHPPPLSNFRKKKLQHGLLALGTQTEFRQRWFQPHQLF